MEVNIEQERLARLNGSRAEARRNPPVFSTAPGATITLPNNLSPAERLNSDRAQERAEQNSLDPTGALSRANENGFIDDETFANYQNQLLQYTQQLRQAQSFIAFREILRRKSELEKELEGIALSNEQREIINAMRDQVWRSIRTGLPELSDAVAGWDLGFFSFLSSVIFYWSFLKGVKYMNDDEPIKLSTVWTVPPMEIKAKDVANLFKRMLFWMVDMVGFVWANINEALVIAIIALAFIILMILYYLLVDQVAGALNPEIRPFLMQFGSDVITPLISGSTN